MKKSMLAAVGMAASALLVSGCVGFDGKPKGEQVSKRKVRTEFTVCAGSRTPNCSDQGPTNEGEYRLLLGLRAPKGTDAPSTFEPVGRDEAFALNRPYQRQLNQAAPSPGNSKWFGWSSEPFAYADDPTAGDFRLRLRLPDDIGRRFKWRPVVGLIDVSAEIPADAKVDCGESLYSREDDANAVCIDAPNDASETRRGYRIKIKQ